MQKEHSISLVLKDDFCGFLVKAHDGGDGVGLYEFGNRI
jgi:hypothetical protein